MADITATLTGQVTITGELTVPMGIVPRGEIEVNENGEYDVTNYETANVAVPQPSGSVTITENGEHDVTDYVTADVQVPQPSGSIEISENGEFDVAEFVQAVVNVESKGVTNVVIGSFTASTSTNKQTINIPYDGNGFPIAALIYPKDGLYNNTTADGKAWYNLVARSAIGLWCMVKANTKSAPTYRSSDSIEANKATVFSLYKGSSATNYTRYSDVGHVIFKDDSPSSYSMDAVAIHSATNFEIYSQKTSSGTEGFRGGITYGYIIVYSE